MTIAWQILDIKSQTVDGLVIGIAYGCTAQLERYLDRQVGEITLDGSSSASEFIPYANLTEDTVISWVKSKLGSSAVAAIETQLSDSVTAKKTEVEARTVIGGLPWRS